MNADNRIHIAASNGTVHRCTGNRTACKVRIGACWQPTNEPLTCVRCGAELPQPAPSAPESVEAEPQSMTIAEMLSALYAHITVYGDMLTIQVIPDMPEATVEVPYADLRTWCERRITSRKTHKNRGVSYSGGGARPGSLHVA